MLLIFIKFPVTINSYPTFALDTLLTYNDLVLFVSVAKHAIAVEYFGRGDRREFTGSQIWYR